MNVAFTLRLEDELDEQLELLAFVERTSKTAIIRRAIENFLAKQPKVEDPRK
jgi:predicted transcriptional regulator